VVATGFIEAGDQMGATRSGGAGAYPELAGELGLAGGGKRRTFLVADADPSILLRRSASASGLSESPISPKICLTPICSSTPDQKFRNRL